jgi:hypothetical protein
MNSQETSPERALPPGALDNDVTPEGQQAADAAAHAAGEGAAQEAPLTKRRLSRRAILGGALGGVAAYVAAACGGSDPTPTPTISPLSVSPLNTPGPRPLTTAAYPNYLPYVARDAINPESVAMLPPEPTFTPTPSKTPTPEATATPEPPTPTPTPPATPFPPGPPSKLGLFVGHNDPQFFDLVATKGVAVVKTLELDRNFLARIKQLSPNTKIVARIDMPQLELGTFDPLPAAQQFVDKALPYATDPDRQPYIDGWEAYNEPVAGTADEMKRLADFEAERTRLLGDRGIRSVIGNFGTGQPPMELWQAFLPAVQTAQQYDGWLGLHEYSAPTMYYMSTAENKGRYPGVTPGDTGWLTLRYRKVYNEILIPAGLKLPLVMTELGVDGYVQNRPGPPDARGWQDFQGYWAENGYGLWGPGAYVEQLVWYDEAMRQDDYVIGGTIYAISPTAGWETYDIRGPAAMVLGQYFSVHAAA